MPESLLNYRFRGTTMSNSGRLHRTWEPRHRQGCDSPDRQKRESWHEYSYGEGMAAKDDCESAREVGDQRIVDLALRAVYKGTGKGKWSFGKGQSWNGKGYHGGKGGKDWGTNLRQKGSGKKGSQGARERWQGRRQNLLDVWKIRTRSRVVPTRR